MGAKLPNDPSVDTDGVKHRPRTNEEPKEDEETPLHAAAKGSLVHDSSSQHNDERQCREPSRIDTENGLEQHPGK